MSVFSSVYPVAQVINADTGAIAYTSFEGDDKGKWSFSSTPTGDYSAPTGNNAYVLNGSNNISKSGLDSTVTYIVSYWTKNSSAFSITGTISGYPVQGRSVNGWNYFEHHVTGHTSVSISGTGSIDELRLYPTNAQMVTYTYDPLIGIRSQCNANNRIAYYEYDNDSRLKLIRDQDNYIVKLFCYNYAGQPESCSNVYYNTALTDTFFRTNCSGTNAGTQVAYTVPANRYYSFTSQADADAKAQADMTANGQAYANSTGSCGAPYIRVEYVDVFYGASTTTADVWIKIYSDASCTSPAYLNNSLTVNYNHININCSNHSTTFNLTQSCTGSEVFITHFTLWMDGPFCFHNTFNVTSGTGYTSKISVYDN